MRLPYNVLNNIHASLDSNRGIHFHSQFGSIDVFNVIQDQNMESAANARIRITTSSSKNVSFVDGQSSFYELDVISMSFVFTGNIPINQNITFSFQVTAALFKILMSRQRWAPYHMKRLVPNW